MGILANFLASIFTTLFAFISTYLAKKVAFGAAVAATLLAVTTAFYVAIKALIAGLAVTFTNQTLLMMFFALLPDNFATCLTIMLSADVLSFLYRHQIMTIRAVASTG